MTMTPTGEIKAPPQRRFSVLRTLLGASVASGLFVFLLALAAFSTRDSNRRAGPAPVVGADATDDVAPPSPGFSTLSDEAVGRAFVAFGPSLVPCFQRALRIDPATRSVLRLGVTLRIDADTTAILEVRGLSAVSPALRRCVQEVLTVRGAPGPGQIGVRDVELRYIQGRVDVKPL